MTPIIAAIRNELIENSDVQTQASSQRYFKESILCYGTKTTIVSTLAKDSFNEVKDKTKSGICAGTETLGSV